MCYVIAYIIRSLNHFSCICLHKVRRQPQSLALPVAHTCFNQLDIPEYDTKEELYNKLLQALTLTTTFDLL